MALYEFEIVWGCKCGESGTRPLMYRDDESRTVLLLSNTHRQERGCDLVYELLERSVPVVLGDSSCFRSPVARRRVTPDIGI